MSTGLSSHVLSPETQRLHLRLVEACEQHRPPCRSRTEWTGENAEDRAAAAEACGHCPHQGPCGAYARAAGERHGVWAAVDRTASATTARRRAAVPA